MENFQYVQTGLDQTSFQEHLFRVVKNRKQNGCVDRQHGQVDCPKSVFLQIKATHFEAMMTTVDEVNSEKTKVR